MTTITGSETRRVLVFGSRHRVAVTLKRANGLWHAHSALLPQPVRKIADARKNVARRLRELAATGTPDTAGPA